MDKFVYAVCTDWDQNEVKTIMARDEHDAKERIVKKYWSKYNDLEEEEWDKFLEELYDKYQITISSKLLELDEL
jgi:hypothetical protein